MITIDDILKMKESLGKGPELSRIRFIESQLLEDDIVIVSPKIFKLIKDKFPEVTGSDLTLKE